MTEHSSLAEAEILRGLSGEQLEKLIPIAKELSLDQGEYLFRLGDDATTLFILIKGTVQLTVPLELGGKTEEVVSEGLEDGASLAWSAMIPPHRLTSNARSTARSELVGFRRADLLAVFDADPLMARIVMTNLAGIVGRRLHVTNAMWLRELQRSVREKFR